MAQFFVSCALEMVDELETELKEIWPYLINKEGKAHGQELKILEKDQGGILLEADEMAGFQINFFSKLANRVLWRIAEFKVKDFPKLFSRLEKIDLSSLIGGEEKWSLEVAASQSRLNNEKRIAETALQAWKKWRKKYSQEAEGTSRIFIRFFQDTCTVSLDTSGEHLHFRAQKHIGKAPLRETLAAFIIRRLVADTSSAKLSGITLVDPMAGSGTLLSEARNLYQGNFARDFSFLHWPKTAKLLKTEKLSANYQSQELLFSRLIARDKDPKMMEILEKQVGDLGGDVKQEDLFMAKRNSLSANTWVVSNFPYGERIKVDFSVREALEKITQVHNPERMGILISESQYQAYKAKPLAGWAEKENHRLSNGGLKTRFIILQK